MQQLSRSSIWQPLIYLIMIGFTFIAMPKTGSTYLVARCVQAVEVILCIALFIQYFRQKIELNNFNCELIYGGYFTHIWLMHLHLQLWD